MALGSLGRQQITVIFHHPGLVWCRRLASEPIYVDISPAAGSKPLGTAAASIGPARLAAALPSATLLQICILRLEHHVFDEDGCAVSRPPLSGVHNHTANGHPSAAAGVAPNGVPATAAASFSRCTHPVSRQSMQDCMRRQYESPRSCKVRDSRWDCGSRQPPCSAQVTVQQARSPACFARGTRCWARLPHH